MTALDQQTIPLSFGADQLAAAAAHKQRAAGHGALGVHHWLLDDVRELDRANARELPAFLAQAGFRMRRAA